MTLDVDTPQNSSNGGKECQSDLVTVPEVVEVDAAPTSGGMRSRQLPLCLEGSFGSKRTYRTGQDLWLWRLIIFNPLS